MSLEWRSHSPPSGFVKFSDLNMHLFALLIDHLLFMCQSDHCEKVKRVVTQVLYCSSSN